MPMSIHRRQERAEYQSGAAKCAIPLHHFLAARTHLVNLTSVTYLIKVSTTCRKTGGRLLGVCTLQTLNSIARPDLQAELHACHMAAAYTRGHGASEQAADSQEAPGSKWTSECA